MIVNIQSQDYIYKSKGIKAHIGYVGENMKKRGVRTKAHKVSNSRKKTAASRKKKPVVAKAKAQKVKKSEKASVRKTKPKQIKAKSRKTKSSGIKGFYEPVAVREEQKVQREIEEEIRYLLTPQEIPVVLFVCSLIILAFLLNSISLIFYTVTTLFVLWISHFFHKHKHRPHDVLAILGIFFLPLIAALIMYRDLLMWFLMFVYLLSALSTLLIYYYHGKKHSPLEIMWQTTYSKVVALTAGALLVSLVPFVLPESFVSITELILVYVFPIVLTVFFISKFLYIYYFEHKHIKNDLWISIRYAVIYALAFVIILCASYALISVQLNNANTQHFQRSIDMALVDSSKIDKVFDNLPEEVRNLQVTHEVISFNKQMFEDISIKKREAMDAELAFGDILDDTYLQRISQNNYDLTRFNTMLGSILEVKAQITGRHEILKETQKRNATMPDGSKTLGMYASTLTKGVNERYTPFYMDSIVANIQTMIEDPATEYDYFENNGINWFFADREGLQPVYHMENVMGRQVMELLRHTTPFRHLSALNFNEFLFDQKERFSGHLQQILFENIEKQESDMSKALRGEILMEKVKGRPPLIILKQNTDAEAE